MGNRRVLCGVVRDITQRLQLEAELLAISQRERRRIGRDLHDSVGQQLAALVFAVASLQNKLAARALPEAADAENLVGLLKKVTAELRSLARGLCPVELKADGLMIALGGLAHSAGSQFGVACTFESDNPVPVHDHTVATHLYRIAQEGLTNAVKHGKAGQVVIRLTASEDQIVLAIEDNGVGIPMPWEQSEGLGLHIMNHRAGILGAALTVQRRAEGGTRVTCLLPRQRAMKPEGRPHDAQ
jgi:signal transduction histidine kinase